MTMPMTMTKAAQLMFERAFTDEVTTLALTDQLAFERTGTAMLRAFQLGREHGRAEALGHADAPGEIDDAVAAITEEEAEHGLRQVLRQAGYGNAPTTGDEAQEG